MSLRKSQRTRRATVAFDDRTASFPASSSILKSKRARNDPETALEAIAAEPLLEIDNQLPELPDYHPLLELCSKPSESIVADLSELQTFKQLYTQEMIDIIVDAINSYAENERENAENFDYAQYWHPVNSTEIWRYIGCLIYMGLHIESQCKEYWGSLHHLSEFLDLKYFQQIHHYFTLQDQSIQS